MVRAAARSLWAEPRAPQPPVRVWRDWALVAVLVPTAVVEAIVRSDALWRPVALGLAVALVFTLLWRRTHPLAVVAVAFGALVTVELAALLWADHEFGLFTTGAILLLPYSLFRWGSGREVALGLLFIMLAAVLPSSGSESYVSDAVGTTVFFLFSAALGAAVRYRDHARRRDREQVILREREQLARELHDTVAHHVSGIAIQAQAGRFLAAASNLEGAADALEVIEEEAARTLAEMRTIVGALREGDAPDLAPQRGVADIKRLATNTRDSPRVDVELSGDLDQLRPSVEATVYRLAQESITNALRHARDATRIEVCVAGDDRTVSLTVTDNGDAGSFGAGASGYGLVGMSERAALVGGTLEAGPSPDRGWLVTAVLPKQGTFT